MSNFIGMKGLIHWGDVKLTNLYKHNNVASKYKRKLNKTGKRNRQTCNSGKPQYMSLSN